MIGLAKKAAPPKNRRPASGTQTNTSMKHPLIAAALLLTLFPALAPAETLKLPEDEPAVSVNIPDSWEPEADGDGILAESPDNVSTIYLEVVADEKEMDTVIEDSLTWLTEDHEVKVNAESKKEGEFETTGRKWSRISWEAESKEWGPAVVGFLFTEVGGGKVLTITYWISKKDSEKSLETLGKIFESTKSIK
jgi:hypothetical protein